MNFTLFYNCFRYVEKKEATYVCFAIVSIIFKIFFLWMWGGYLVWFMVFNVFQLYRGGQFFWWKKPEYPEKTTDLLQVTDKLYHIM